MSRKQKKQIMRKVLFIIFMWICMFSLSAQEGILNVIHDNTVNIGGPPLSGPNNKSMFIEATQGNFKVLVSTSSPVAGSSGNSIGLTDIDITYVLGNNINRHYVYGVPGATLIPKDIIRDEPAIGFHYIVITGIQVVNGISRGFVLKMNQSIVPAPQYFTYDITGYQDLRFHQILNLNLPGSVLGGREQYAILASARKNETESIAEIKDFVLLIDKQNLTLNSVKRIDLGINIGSLANHTNATGYRLMTETDNNDNSLCIAGSYLNYSNTNYGIHISKFNFSAGTLTYNNNVFFETGGQQGNGWLHPQNIVYVQNGFNNRGTLLIAGSHQSVTGGNLTPFLLSYNSTFTLPTADFVNDVPPINAPNFLIRGVFNSNIQILGNEIFVGDSRGDLISYDWAGNINYIKSMTNALRSTHAYPMGDFSYDAAANLFYGVTLVNNIMSVLTVLPNNTDGCCYMVRNQNPVGIGYNFGRVVDLFPEAGLGQENPITLLENELQMQALVACSFCNPDDMQIVGPTEVWCEPDTFFITGCPHFTNARWTLIGPGAHNDGGKITSSDNNRVIIDFTRITHGGNPFPGSYQLRYSELIAGEDPACSPILATLNITFKTLACSTASISGNNAIICNGSEMYTFNGCTNFPAFTNYQWNINNTSGNLEASFNGSSVGTGVNIDYANATANNTYDLTVTATHRGCTFTSPALPVTHSLPAFSGIVTGPGFISCNSQSGIYSISNPDNITINSYLWTISPSGPTITNGSTSMPSVNFSTGTASGVLTLTCHIDIGGCIVERQITIQVEDCCPINNTSTNEYQSSYNILDKSNTNQAYIGKTLAIFTSSNNHTMVLQNMTNITPASFTISEMNTQGQTLNNQIYTPTPNTFEATDMIESHTANGKIVIGQRNNNLYLLDISPTGIISNQKIITLPNSNNCTIEATSVVKSYYTGNAYGYAILVNLKDASNNNRVFLVGCYGNFSAFWYRELAYSQTNVGFHAHKLLGYTDYSGNTGTFIVLGKVLGGGVTRGVIMDTKITYYGGTGTPVMRVSDNIYFSGAVMPDSGYVFGGSDNATSFSSTASAAFLRTDFNLNMTFEKTLSEYRMEALNVITSASSGNPIFLLLSKDLSGSANLYYYHLLELDMNLAVITGKNIQTLNQYKNNNNDHDPYVACKTLLDRTAEGGYIIAGQEETGFDFVLCKTGNNLIGRCNTSFVPTVVNHINGFKTNAYLPSTSNPTISSVLLVNLSNIDMERVCCNIREGGIFSKCSNYKPAQNVHYTPVGIDFFTGAPVVFEAMGDFSSSDVDYYEWNFGDGTTYTSSTDPHTTHIFTIPSGSNSATYTVNLTIHYKNGCTKNYVNVITINRCLTPTSETTCHKTIYICDVAPDPEGVIPDCADCYPSNPSNPIELSPLELVSSVNGITSYRREIINRDNCNKCIFTFDIIDKACDFQASFTSLLIPGSPNGNAMYSNTSTSGPGTNPCGLPSWTVLDLTFMIQIPVPDGQNANFPIQTGHIYKICMTVKYCACGRECSKTICETITIGLPELKQNTGTSDKLPASSLQTKSLNTSSLFKNNTDLAIKPNPTAEKFTIFNLSGLDQYEQVSIYNINGQVILQMENVTSGFEYNLSDYAKGIYMVKITVNGEIKILKLVLQ